ncbi:MAG: DNA invertase Pin-like site-specific DNA recombinase [Maribacter sp.]|jgi:DNA invertase Pin-like site-specific DNA recombinase
MKTTSEHDERMAKMTFASVYPHYITKVESKGRTKEELHQVIEWLTQKYTNTELCRVFEISRPTVYKMISRYENSGIKRLKEKQKSPLNHPDRTKETVNKNIVSSKKE